MFSGVGGFELGIKKAMPKAKCIGFSEIDPYAAEIYQKHFPKHKNFGDATKISTKDLPEFDLLCAGFPCQAFSIAGKRKGFKDSRGTLFFEIERVLESKKPSYLLLENVKGLLSHEQGRTFAYIIQRLDELGYCAEWMVLNSKDFKVPQNRERVYIAGYHRTKAKKKILPYGSNIEVFNQANPKGLELQYDGDYQSKRIYSVSGVSPTIPTSKTGGNHIPFISEIHQEIDSIRN